MSQRKRDGESEEDYLRKELLRFTTAGSVDDGKSTLIGRLLFDSKQILKDQMAALERASELRGESEVNLALLTDGLRAEREQGITIDVAYRYFSTPARKFIIADTPGHEQYTRNMVTGASTADLAIVLIDARNGVTTQSKRHGFLASLLGIPHLLVAINKMDLVGYSEAAYREIHDEYLSFSEKLDIHDIVFIPVSALKGDNIVKPGKRMSWYKGTTVLHHLETVTIAPDRNLIDFRFPVQYVIRPHQDFRGFSGRVASGSITCGEEILVLPSKTRSKVKAIFTPNGDAESAFEGQSVVLSLADEVDVSRGDQIVRIHNVPTMSKTFDAILCWMDNDRELSLSTHYQLQQTTRTVKAYVRELSYKIDVNTLHRQEASHLSLNEIGRVTIETGEPLVFDEYGKNRHTGSFILVNPVTHLTVAAGMIRGDGRSAGFEAQETDEGVRSQNIKWDYSEVTHEKRESRNRHRAACLWFTGLSSSGKSTLAKTLEKRLFDSGAAVFRLDGDNVRHGLCSDLGFSPEDRRNNIRRVGHAARLLYDAGNIVLCSFISPYGEDRDFVRGLFPEGRFIEVFVKCELEVCIDRDPKGLYKKAIAGEIPSFTGISAPYEEPIHPEIVAATDEHDLETLIDDLTGYLARNGIIG